MKESHVARFGGDEFALLLPCIDFVTAARLAEVVRDGVAALGVNGGERTLSVSIGGASANGAEALNEVIRRADVALYRAKYRGRNRVEFSLEEMDATEDASALEFVSLA